MFVVLFPVYFPELSIVVWLFKILFALFVIWKWSKKIKGQSKLKFFKPSFLSMGLYWSIIIAIIVWKNEIGSIMIFLFGIFWIAGIILSAKMLKDSGTAIRKYYPTVMRKYNNSGDSIDTRLENLEKKLLELKESSPAIVVDAIMKRETMKLIWPFHIEMVFLIIMIFWGTNYI